MTAQRFITWGSKGTLGPAAMLLVMCAPAHAVSLTQPGDSETAPATDASAVAAPDASFVEEVPSVDGPAASQTMEGALQALVIDVKGRAEWRPDEDSPWRAARLNDLLDPGSSIRTGMPAAVTLRIGKNATVMVDSLSLVKLPEILEDGQTLRSRVAIVRGKADFKVDHVGLDNDFEVVTPSTVLSVRGTEYSVRHGGFEGTDIDSFDGNEMRAIEVRYFGTAMRHYLDAKSTSGNKQPDPALAALFDTVGPPPLSGGGPAAQQQTAEMGFQVDPFVSDNQSITQAPTEQDIFLAGFDEDVVQAFLEEQNAVPPPVAPPPHPGLPSGPFFSQPPSRDFLNVLPISPADFLAGGGSSR